MGRGHPILAPVTHLYPLALLLLALTCAGCLDACRPEAPVPAIPSAETTPEPTPPTATTAPVGTVQGIVRGGPAPSELIPAEPGQGCEGSAGLSAGTVRRGADGELAAAVVHLRGDRAPTATPEPTRHTLALSGCLLDRRALVARVGDELVLDNADDRYHALALHRLDGGNTVRHQTLSLAPGERGVHLTLTEPGFYRLASDQLPWLRGLVLVLGPGEQGAVTDADGAFTVNDLAPGSWSAVIRHEVLGAHDDTVEVPAGETAALYASLGISE